MQIGPYKLVNNLALAPMAGVTDLPFRLLCRRMDHSGEPEPRVVQIAGGDPEMMAEAARRNVDAGAQIIDINMGCPAKKVCNKAAGSALLKDEPLVRQILEAVVKAVDVPVTLKTRTGWNPDLRTGPAIARMAESIGVQALAIHGRTRACMYQGNAEYDTIAHIKQSVSIPIFANGDIDSGAKAKLVLEQTGVDGLMIGRSAQGRPWIFREIFAALSGGAFHEPSFAEVRDIMLAHLRDLHAFYGEEAGVRVARKHIDWYAKSRASAPALRQAVMQATDASTQIDRVQAYFDALAEAPEEVLSSAA